MVLILESLFKKFIVLVLLSSCSGDDEGRHYSASQMWDMAYKFDSSIEMVSILEEKDRILCNNYPGTGCVVGTGKKFKIRKVELVAIQYETEKQAKDAAFKIDQWYAGNWLFDLVTGEPVLESYVQSAFQAKRPTQETEKEK